MILEKDYKSPIPNVLIALKSGLFRSGGHLKEGIFRTAPNGTECKMVEEALNEGHFGDVDFESIDGEVTANLIKLWFRSLPHPVLKVLSKGDRIESVQSVDDTVGIITDYLGEPQRSHFLWLIDLCVDVIAHTSSNKMTPKAIAVVMAPNLYDPESFENPMKCMTFSAAVIRFVQFAIEWRGNGNK